ncbi:ribosomal protein S5 domain 2-type protein [Haematococcus lacustris]
MPDSYPSSSPPVAQLHATHLSDDVCQAACAHLQQLWAPGEVVVHTWVEWLKEQRHLFTVGGQPEAAQADSHGAMEKEEEGEEGRWVPEHEGEHEEQRQDHGGVIGVAQCSARLGGGRGPVEGQLTQSGPRAQQGAAAEVAFLLESVRSRIVSGLPVTERKSTFQAHVAKVDSAQEAQAMVTALLENNKIRGATHNIMAYRIPSSHVGNFHTDCDDDGETAAGGRLLHLLQVADAQRVVVVVTRWYGGVQLGPVRFTLINNVARTLLEQQGFICPGGRAHGAGGDAKRAGVPSKAQR